MPARVTHITLKSLVGDFATVTEAASVLRCDPRTVHRMIARGEIPATRVGDQFRIPTAWLRQQVRKSA